MIDSRFTNKGTSKNKSPQKGSATKRDSYTSPTKVVLQSNTKSIPGSKADLSRSENKGATPQGGKRVATSVTSHKKLYKQSSSPTKTQQTFMQVNVNSN
jgi:hypothetical protein